MIKKERFQLIINDNALDEEHFHQEMELLYILEGDIDVIIEKKVSHLKTDDMYIVNANRKHSFKTKGSILMMRLLISYQLVTENSVNGEAIFWCDSSVSDSDKYGRLRQRLRQMLNHYVENRNYTDSFGYLADCYGILEYLTAHFMLRASDTYKKDNSDRYEERLSQINHYIYNNYDQPISMKELSEKLYLSNGYLSRFFKKNYGMSFAGYLTNIRVFHAADDLLYTDDPITRIAYNNGFTSAALFNKVFKKAYGQTPSEFRKKSTRVAQTRTQEHQEQLEKKLEKVLARDETEVDLVPGGLEDISGEYTVQFYDSLKNNWGSMVNFGDASNLLHSSTREHLMLLREALGFEYVRFWSLFTEDFFIRPEQEHYNFSQIDSVLDFVLEMGLKPHIELGIKPSTIHYEIGNTEFGQQNTMNDFSPVEWERLMRAFMRHLSHHYGQNVLDKWRMELWFDESWRNEEENYRRYIELFNITYKAVKNCNENIQVGGYGIRMDVGAEQRLKFLKRWNLADCRPDFLSIMFYAYERKEDGLDQYARRNTDNEALLHHLLREKSIIAEAGMWDLPLIISEWNLTPSVRNYINDTTFKGAYIVKNILDIYGKADVIAYGAGTDRQYTSFDTPDLLFGGTGLLTKDAIMKPAAFAFDFLNRLYPYYIGKEKNYLITTDRHDNYGIICHNQQTLNYNYYLTPETEMERSAMWKYYEERRKLRIHIRLEGVTNGSYRVKVYRINDNSGSVLKIWGDLDYVGDLSRDDLKYFRRVCEPNMTIRSMETHDSQLLIEEELLPNELMFIRVRYNT